MATTRTTKRPRILMLADADRPRIREQAVALRPMVEQHVEVVDLIDNFVATELETDNIDFAMVLGGDGSMLRAAHLLGYEQLPILGVNLGRLGFLADLQPEQLPEVLPRVAAGEYRVISHLMFECEVLRNGKVIERALGLNEASVLAGPPFEILEIQLYVDAELVTTYSCDGLIVSSPVGSTAHNLSAGGPILRKDLQAFVISPINPHTLTNRPVVDSAERVYELRVPNPLEGTALVVDGKILCQPTAEDRIRITRSEAQFQLIEFSGYGYYRTLREKLGWGGRLKLDE
ncbi:MAG: NAD(+)/NADH kinase [Bythopirellula sp.]|nr:NAD(+)/NADH kinase [Bythopirellula sp.]